MSSHETIETSTHRCWLEVDGILRVVVRSGSACKLTDAVEIVAAAKRLLRGRKVPVLVDIGAAKSITREAREYLASDGPAALALAQALLVSSAVSKVIGNFFLGLNHATYPTKLFTNNADAVTWLRGVQNQHGERSDQPRPCCSVGGRVSR